ncbi:MAG: hypothetical protein ABJP70_08335 [Erythrobacter sp.]
MLGQALLAFALLATSSATEWQEDGSAKIDITFAANDPSNPFPQGEKLLKTAAKEACEDKGKPKQVGETVVTGISFADGKPQVSMSGTYVCK